MKNKTNSSNRTLTFTTDIQTKGGETLSRNLATRKKFSGQELLILYNRIPKTGSTSFMKVLYDLHSRNGFTAAYVNVSSKTHRFTFADQYWFALNITNWHSRKPAIYHGHFPFLNFISLGLSQPIYINIIREPLERVVSHYYFIRYGDTFLPDKIRKYQGDTRTFDQCVKDRSSQCKVKMLWLQIPYFCGSEPECWKVGSQYALDRAKFNVITYYYLVGVTDRISEFVELLEYNLPTIFKGSKELFTKDGGLYVRKTKKKVPLLRETIDYFQETKIWKMENEFYLFVKDRFNYIYSSFNKDLKVSYVKMRPG